MGSKHTRNFRYEIGQNFKDEKRDYTIINRERRTIKGISYKFYEYHCNKCNGESWISESHLKQGNGCGICRKSPRKVVKGINDLATTNPEMVKYFVNKGDTYSYAKASNKKVLMKCPYCGFERMYSINDLYTQGFSCPKCSVKDGISFPEKFMTNVLEQLKEQGQLNYYTYQYTKVDAKWCGKYKYDFYFELNDERYIIETHGGQHYRDKWQSVEEVQRNDEEKRQLALSNNIDNYIVIDCSQNYLHFIKNNILSSELNNLFDLTHIDWNLCTINSQNNMVKEVCDYWHLHNDINGENLSTGDLEKVFNLARGTIKNHLKKGAEISWCNYDPKEEYNKKYDRKKKPFELYKDGEFLGVFSCAKDLERQSESLFGVKLWQGSISKVLIHGGNHKGFTFKRITKEEYENRIKNY